jgi:hypothetical protein
VYDAITGIKTHSIIDASRFILLVNTVYKVWKVE